MIQNINVRKPKFGDIIIFPTAGHVGINLSRNLYISASAPRDTTNIQPHSLIIKFIPNADIMYRSPDTDNRWYEDMNLLDY
jgi:hypothetical protein